MIVSTQAINEALKKSLNNLTIVTELGGISKDFERDRAFNALTELKDLLDQVAKFNPDNYNNVEEYNKQWQAKRDSEQRNIDLFMKNSEEQQTKKEESNVVRKKGKK